MEMDKRWKEKGVNEWECEQERKKWSKRCENKMNNENMCVLVDGIYFRGNLNTMMSSYKNEKIKEKLIENN